MAVAAAWSSPSMRPRLDSCRAGRNTRSPNRTPFRHWGNRIPFHWLSQTTKYLRGATWSFENQYIHCARIAQASPPSGQRQADPSTQLKTACDALHVSIVGEEGIVSDGTQSMTASALRMILSARSLTLGRRGPWTTARLSADETACLEGLVTLGHCQPFWLCFSFFTSYFLQNPHFRPITESNFFTECFQSIIQSISLSSLAEKKNIVSSVHRQQHGQGGLSATRQQVNKLRLESRWSRMLRTTWTHLVQRAARRAGCWEPQVYIFNQASFQSIRASFQPTQRFNHRWTSIVYLHELGDW